MTLRTGELRLQAGEALGRNVRLQIGCANAHSDRGTLERSDRLGRRDRILVGLHHLGSDARPGKPLGAERGGARHRGPPNGLLPQIPQRLGERLSITAGDEHAVDAVAHHVAVAGDVGRHDRRARRERLGQDHAKALSPQRRRTQDVA